MCRKGHHIHSMCWEGSEKAHLITGSTTHGYICDDSGEVCQPALRHSFWQKGHWAVVYWMKSCWMIESRLTVSKALLPYHNSRQMHFFCKKPVRLYHITFCKSKKAKVENCLYIGYTLTLANWISWSNIRCRRRHRKTSCYLFTTQLLPRKVMWRRT